MPAFYVVRERDLCFLNETWDEEYGKFFYTFVPGGKYKSMATNFPNEHHAKRAVKNVKNDGLVGNDDRLAVLAFN